MGTSSYHVCYHCKDRVLGCHAKCEAYLKEKRENEQRLKERREIRENSDALASLHRHRVRSTINRGKFSHKK